MMHNNAFHADGELGLKQIISSFTTILIAYVLSYGPVTGMRLRYLQGDGYDPLDSHCDLIQLFYSPFCWACCRVGLEDWLGEYTFWWFNLL